MPAIIRNTGPRGARFYDDAGTLMFVNVVDASTRDGPRAAVKADQTAHPEAFQAFKGGHQSSSFPGAEPMITFSGKRPAQVPDPERLAKPADAAPAE